MSGLTSKQAAQRVDVPAILPKLAATRRWHHVAGAWLGIGTSPGALLLGAGLAARYGGPVPLISILLSALFMFILLWFQGSLGLARPLGEGANLNQITPRYFGVGTQRMVGAVIALGMVGWLGFNIGLGGASLGALLHLPDAAGALLLGLPIVALSLRGLHSWNRLASLTTLAVLALVGIIVSLLAARTMPVTLALPTPVGLVMDVAVFIGYISVFTVRAPDFTVGLPSRRDLLAVEGLLIIPILLIALAGVGLQQGTGSADLVGILAEPGGLAIGNLLVAISVIAPTFTALYSGAPALQAAFPMQERLAMLIITSIGLTLAVLRFDLKLLPWVTVLAAMLPPLVVPLAVESTRRRRGNPDRLIPLWVWAPGALFSMLLSLMHNPLAPLVGFLVTALATAGWYFFSRRRLVRAT